MIRACMKTIPPTYPISENVKKKKPVCTIKKWPTSNKNFESYPTFLRSTLLSGWKLLQNSLEFRATFPGLLHFVSHHLIALFELLCPSPNSMVSEVVLGGTKNGEQSHRILPEFVAIFFLPWNDDHWSLGAASPYLRRGTQARQSRPREADRTSAI